MTIRRAKEKDIPRINDLLGQVYLVHHNGRPDLFDGLGRKYTDEELKIILRDDTRPVFVAEDETGYVQGYCFCIYQQIIGDTVRTDVRTLYIDDLCVDENARGLHIGQQLYEYVRNFAEKNDFYNITLRVWSCNEGAARFYEAMGLEPQYVCLETILQ